MEQPQYHLFCRSRVEKEYKRLYDQTGLGLTTWSPLASGLLTGKYRQGVPAGSRGSLHNMAFLVKGLTDGERNAAVAQLEPIARELGGTLAQLAIAWVNRNPHVSTVILGASKLSQLQDNLGALALTPQLSDEVMGRIDRITKTLAD
jgi:aryl-alcohol dehydrogenase-like predicted oxidoreductase